MKKLFVVLCVFILFLFLPKNAFSVDNFYSNVIVDYEVQESGITLVTHRVAVQNLISEIYATSYTLTLDNINPQKLNVYEGSNRSSFSVKKEGERTSIIVQFQNPVVGKGKSKEFSIVYEVENLAVRTGEVWEISIPRLSPNESSQNYQVRLSVPRSFGTEAYIYPSPQEVFRSDSSIQYTFDRSSISKNSIVAAFGSFQIFSFVLNYHLENPLPKIVTTEIALPPDTHLQRVYYHFLNPKPNNVYLDPDGNWLAVYILRPRERVDIEARGTVQIFSGPRTFLTPSPDTLQANLQPTKYWQSDNEKIQSLAKKLVKPRNIYDFVWQNLSYNYSRVKPNVERLGAEKALEEPQNAICMEFTDLFIALARAAGTPAREINGFAYTENPNIQPLSLVADVLHSWPEYWDSEKKVWVAIDPTWASTTKGVDFFSKLDLRHFTFVIHGRDDQKPFPPGSYKLGPNPQKDVFVSFGSLPEERISYPIIEVHSIKRFPFTSPKYKVRITNPGPVALYNLPTSIFFDDKTQKIDNLEALLPFASVENVISIPYSFLGSKTPEKITVIAGDRQFQMLTEKNQIINEWLIVVSVVVFTLLLFALFKLKGVNLKIWLQKFIKAVRKQKEID